ncbi:GTPase-associated system all-helical protein GASH [Pseudomonas sp. OV546]|uniref:GTPase-associated system all-helical protein GASH n=1 Tax=Pseudomonas sp. OV546 TaxID=1881063 RepID=UPI0008E716CB|nr:GTPase-associated system all-helical protein GASH [Pseudomonas sp. OV546]SFU95012.1 hypothetical protein SAMN05428951_10725 [Pseudomonas sp. OV546]
MSLMAKHSRIFWPEPKDDDVRRLNQAVVSVQTWMQGISTAWLAIELASRIAAAFESGLVDENIAVAVEQAIVENGSDAFVRENNDLQITVVAVVAALDLVRRETVGEHDTSAVDAFAAAAWSALSFQDPVEKESLEMLRIELCDACQKRSKDVAEESRIRAEVPEVGLLSIPDNVPTGARAKQAFKTAVTPLVKALRENAELDREEIDFLWWRLADWSESLERPFPSLPSLTQAVTAGLECAAKLKRIPSSGHRNVVLRGIGDDVSSTLPQVISTIGENIQALVSGIDSEGVLSAKQAFPLLSALVSDDCELSGSNTPRTIRDWGARALLEAGVMHLSGRRG